MQEEEKEERQRRAFAEIMSMEVPLSPDSKKLNDINKRLDIMTRFVDQRLMEKEQNQIRAVTILQEGKSRPKIAPELEKPGKPVAFFVPSEDISTETPPKLNVSGTLKPPTELKTILTKPPPPRASVKTETKKNIIRPTYVSTPETGTCQPAPKLLDKNSSFTNRDRIVRSLQFSIFPNQVDKDKLEKVKKSLELSAAKHFLILFRDQKCQYRGLYSWNQQSTEVEKVSGLGPDKCSLPQLKLMFKYQDSRKVFAPVPSKSFSNVIDGFTINDAYWHKARNTLNSTMSSMNQLSI